jgi:hypothetical protein
MQLEHQVLPSGSNLASLSSFLPQPGSPALFRTPFPPQTRQEACQRLPFGPGTTPGSITATILSQPAHRFLFGATMNAGGVIEAVLSADVGRGAADCR